MLSRKEIEKYGLDYILFLHLYLHHHAHLEIMTPLILDFGAGSNLCVLDC